MMYRHWQPPPPPPSDKPEPTLRSLKSVLTPEVIDALAPNHRKGRYWPDEDAKCSDEDPRRGLEWDHGTKNWRCLRCVLLSTAAGEYDFAPDWMLECWVKLEVEGVR